MNKTVLRDKLFEKYFEVEDGILAIDLVDKLSFIPELWEQLHLLCEKNVEYFDSFSDLEKFKLLEHHQRRYLILKLRMFRYIIIDIERMENITIEQFKNEFNESFFINNFNEIKTQQKNLNMYSIFSYNGNVKEIVDFYMKNQSIFCLSTKLHYRLDYQNAWTYFYIDFVNARAQMGFQTPNQFLYEQLFLKYNLQPSKMQDAQSKIGIEKMKEMFEKIKEIKIPKEVIPNDLYEQYLIQNGREKCDLKLQKVINNK